MTEEINIIRQEKDYRTGWLDGYNKCLEDYNITQMAMLQFPSYTFPIDVGNKVLVAQISELQTQIAKMKENINCLVHLGEFNENTDEEYLNHQVHEALQNAYQFLNY